ncbi:MAG TPA: serine hydroxymethyltransferase [Patescibacteria group bacterium]
MMNDQIFELIEKEKERQQKTLMMIPSENYTYPEVMAAVGSVLMQKYAEGYPGRRYYQGNEIIDQVEELCRKRALEAFKLNPQDFGVNVQPHSGSEANLAVYNALLNVGDKIMALYLPDGGHLSHGWSWSSDKKTTLVSKIFNISFYKVDSETKLINYEDMEKQAMEFKPKLIITGGTAYPREIDYKRVAEIAKKSGAYYLADVAHEAGLIAAGVCKSPFEYADVVTMTTHKTLRGPRGAMIFAKKELMTVIDPAVMPGLQGGPHQNTIAGIALSLEKTKTNEFKDYAKRTIENAARLAVVLSENGLDIVTGGTDKHLILVDLRNMKMSGWFPAQALEYAGIIVNRNTVPNETASPFYPSGIRMGVQALAAREMEELEMEKVGKWIAEIIRIIGEREIPEDKEERKNYLQNFREEMKKNKRINEIREEVEKMCAEFPVK